MLCCSLTSVALSLSVIALRQGSACQGAVLEKVVEATACAVLLEAA